MSKNLVIVESPAKAKTIEKYLGKDFHVLSSVGHIRTDTKVDVNNDFAVTYEIEPKHKKVVTELKKAAKAAEVIWLATDEDREGEAISWHLAEVLKLPKNTHRITFHEITKPALEEAIKNPRTVDMDMVSSQQARQTLDMLVGYDLSGVVRRKVPGAISAGRVQSPALRLIVEKEREIEKFDAKSTFKITGDFSTSLEGADSFTATLEKTTIKSKQSAKNLLNNLKSCHFFVSDIDESAGTKSAPAPFSTASLQIEANAKLGFSSKTTMSAAQGLYQSGLITYHRTDSLNLSEQAISSISSFVKSKYGDNYHKTRRFKTKSASAQEAHEAIRPTDITREIAGKSQYEQKLYQLIRSRTLATQMADAKIAKTTLKITPKETETDKIFVAKGEVVIFDGFLKVYGKSKDLILPKLAKNTEVFHQTIKAKETFSKPPARYTEGSLVKKLEELGIGRPSTYASIISAIQIRGYVIKGESEGEPRDVIELVLDKNSNISENILQEKSGANKGKLLPTPSGELLSDFLVDHFNNIVDYAFTAGVEEKLDQIAERKLARVKMLSEFYKPFSQTIVASEGVNRYNAARELGLDPKTGKPIFAKIGKNGGFIQLGTNEQDSGEKPRFAPLPNGTTTKSVTLKQALAQLELPALPRTLGKTKDGTEIIAANGPFGPYLKAGKYNIQLKNHDPYSITLATAEQLYDEKKSSIIADWGEISIIHGAYGPYIKGPGRLNNLKIPKDQDPKSITKEQAMTMLQNSPRNAAKTAKALNKTNKAKTPTKTTKRAKTPSKTPKKATRSTKTTKKTTKTNNKA